MNHSEYPDPLSAPQLALARHHLYTLLSQLFLCGLTVELYHTIQAIPELANTLALPFDADQAAATHQEVLVFQVFPYQSAFLALTGLLGGEEAERVRHSYRISGFSVPTTSDSPDHMGLELDYLAFLCGAEADAWRDSLPAESLRAQRLQRDFLEQNLLRWLVPAVLAIRNCDQPFYSALATLALEFVSDHYMTLSELDSPPHFALPVPPPLLGDSETSLEEIVAYLLTPAYSGIFISRNDLAQLARRHEVPRGFGDRSQVFTNLLRAAGKYDALPLLIDDITGVARQWYSKYDQCNTDVSSVSRFVTPWRLQTSATVDLLEVLKDSIAHPTHHHM